MSTLQSNRLSRGRRFAFFLPVLLGGCAVLQPAVEVPEPPPEPVEAAPVIVEAPPPQAPPAPSPPPAPEPAEVQEPVWEPKQVAILLSDDIPVFTSVADKLGRRVGEGHHTVHNLDGHPANTVRALDEIKSTNPDHLVSIGLLAAQVGQQLEDVPMVFCYVFNYEEHELISETSKGVNLLPPFAMQLEAWRELSPDLARIGVITGPNQGALTAEIQEAVEGMEIELFSRTVNSDQEALYVFKRLTPDIQGLWLLPDNRILSPRVVREIMSYGARHRIQIVVFGSSLLDFGALMAITSREGDVADQVVSRLDEAEDGELPGPDMMPLTKMDLDINPDVAQHLGLIPAERSARSSQSE